MPGGIREAVGLEGVQPGHVRIKVAPPIYKTEIKGGGEPPRWPRDIPLSAKLGTKIRRPATVAQSVEFVCGIKATELIADIKKL
jgi:hypothetical protein